MTVKREYARIGDYYAGNLSVNVDDHDLPKLLSRPTVSLVWESWGGHGHAEIVFEDAAEIRKLCGILAVAADEKDRADV